MELKSGNITLRSLKEEDAALMAELANNIKVSRNLRDGFPHPYTLKDSKLFIQNFSHHPQIKVFAIEFKDNYVGNISLAKGQDVYRKSAEIGYFIGEPYWNKGIITTAIIMITDYGFKLMDVLRIHAGVFEYNTASQHVLEKCGFNKEGIFRKSIYKENRLWDEIRYAKLIYKSDF
ncbi:MAG: GNAT family N-acetyltransferase [Bacteroidetes bacterium]|nr:GNAT family N-acetyltransferase [Bacteroidota bacterium]